MFINRDTGDRVRLLAQDAQSLAWFCAWGEEVPAIDEKANPENPPEGVSVVPSHVFFTDHREATQDEANPKMIEGPGEADEAKLKLKNHSKEKEPS